MRGREIFLYRANYRKHAEPGPFDSYSRPVRKTNRASEVTVEFHSVPLYTGVGTLFSLQTLGTATVGLGAAILNKPLILVAGIAGAAAFLFLVKLMYDMTVQMTRMTEQVTVMTRQVTAMTGHMERMAGEVGRIREDVNGMRRSVEGVSGVMQKGREQMQKLNPMEMMQGIVPGGQRR